MSILRVNVIARNPKREQSATVPVEALVNTGSELTWIPADILKNAGITPSRKGIWQLATRRVTRLGMAAGGLPKRLMAW